MQEAMIHSKNARGMVEIIRKAGDNDYIVKTEDGIVCHAIFNPLFYADDKYAVVSNG